MLVNHKANAEYYALRPGQPKDTVPASAAKLVEQIAAYAGPKHKVVVNLKEAPMFAPPPDDAEAVRGQLADSSLRLQKILDPQWKEFLALPGEVYAEGKTPSKDAFEKCLGRYNSLTNDARYQELSARAEFRETHALLNRYRIALEGSRSDTLKLPPPPR